MSQMHNKDSRTLAECESKIESLPPATKLGQGYVFTGVCDSVHRGGVCLSACCDATPPPEADTPRPGAPPRNRPPGSRHPPGPGTPPRSRHPPEQTPPTLPGPGTAPRRACWEIRSTRGRSASYWNAILFH